MIIVGCSTSKDLARKIARHLKCKYMQLEVKRFPDNEIYLRFKRSVDGEIVILVQSLAKNPNENLIELTFAASTAKELKAKRVVAVIPYLAYMRQDKRFKKGECVSSRIMAKILESSGIDEIFVVNPHLHRYKSLSDIFSVKTNLISVAYKFADYILAKIGTKNTVIVGPDFESYRHLVEKVARKTRCDFTILKKRRIGPKIVRIFSNKKIFQNKNVVIVDDIVSTGGTIVEVSKLLKNAGAKKIYLFVVHLLSEEAVDSIKKAGVSEIFSTNTVPNKSSKMIDVSDIIASALKKYKSHS